ncbi:LysR family transcriptional regulator [Pseudoduganella namucuonensis]|uniref:DNA-binding transcriptional regulator, LysR family n=1 Tax=Pseudoduganella namucuonensis TaxID=1035707 RepID=A0A1I7LJ15_9BURK|nr:LysR family transcriptional regulator [Pseudoduganella namucuonensis]SFV09663.1 DNA-binding transcriptional regulator, LysR family [Pseudoduganella namucuonensis]
MTKPKLNQLEMLVAVADEGSFGGAAAALDCTQSRVSHGIGELENTLGQRLLHRSRSGCTPTDAGHRVLATARQILRLAASLGDAAREDAAVAGHLRLACFRSVSTHLLPSALAALEADHPGLRVDVDDGFEERDALAQALRDGRADVAIVQLPAGAGLRTRDYVADSYVLVAPGSLALRAPLSWEQLDGLPYIQLDCAGALGVAARCREAGFAAPPARTLATDSSIAALAARGLGYSILPRLAVHPLPDGVQTMPLPIPARRQFAIAAMPATAREPAARALIRYLANPALQRQSEAYRKGLLE